jgi:hypothetical protein
MNVFKNYVPPGEIYPNEVQKQAHPAVGNFPWLPQRSMNFAQQPHEKHSFFTVKGKSGTGAASGESK